MENTILHRNQPHYIQNGSVTAPGSSDSLTLLPPHTDVDVTGSHIEHVARCIQGGAGPGGSSAVQWHDYLLRYGSHSA